MGELDCKLDISKARGSGAKQGYVDAHASDIVLETHFFVLEIE